jgi:hypothetical protein
MIKAKKKSKKAKQYVMANASVQSAFALSCLPALASRKNE